MRLFIFTCVSGLFLNASAIAGPLDVNGLWLTQSRSAHIEVADCGDGTPCGTLVWIDFKAGDSGLDDRNPDTTLHTRPLLGLLMLREFKEGGSSWRGGKIYDPEKGKTYRSNLKLKKDDTLQVKGCVGPICQAQIWTRVSTE